MNTKGPAFKSTSPLTPDDFQTFIGVPSPTIPLPIPSEGSQSAADGAAGKEKLAARLSGYSNEGVKAHDNYSPPKKTSSTLFPR